MEKQPGSLESIIGSMEKQPGYLESIIGVESVFPVESIVGRFVTTSTYSDGFQSIRSGEFSSDGFQEFSSGMSVIANNQRASERLGMFYLSIGREEDGTKCKEIRVYLLHEDMYSSGEFKNIQPLIRFQFDLGDSHQDTFCFVDSTLYVFDGFEPTRRPPGTPRKSARKCDLSESQQLEKICDMNRSKWRPVAIPTPDSKKILVFSGALLDKYAKYDLEMYDISADSWQTIPGLPIRSIYPAYSRFCHSAISYGFIDDSHFLLETTDGTFTLNLQSKKWSQIHNWRVHPSWWCRSRGQFISLLGGKIAVTPTGVYECINHERLIKEVGVKGPVDIPGDPCGYIFRLSEANLSKFPPTNPPCSLIPFPSIHPLHIEEAEVLTCTLQAQEDETVGARVSIDISRVDLKTHKMEVINTIRAHIDNVLDHPILKLIPL